MIIFRKLSLLRKSRNLFFNNGFFRGSTKGLASPNTDTCICSQPSPYKISRLNYSRRDSILNLQHLRRSLDIFVAQLTESFQHFRHQTNRLSLSPELGLLLKLKHLSSDKLYYVAHDLCFDLRLFVDHLDDY